MFGWLFRMIWGKELQLRQQIADADVENLDATFDFLTSACRLAAHILLGWGEGDASSAYIARLFLIEQYDEALNCILPYSNVSLNANETELVVSDLRDRAIAAAMRRGETAAMETKLHKAEDGPHYSSGEDSTRLTTGRGLTSRMMAVRSRNPMYCTCSMRTTSSRRIAISSTMPMAMRMVMASLIMAIPGAGRISCRTSC